MEVSLRKVGGGSARGGGSVVGGGSILQPHTLNHPSPNPQHYPKSSQNPKETLRQKSAVISEKLCRKKSNQSLIRLMFKFDPKETQQQFTRISIP